MSKSKSKKLYAVLLGGRTEGCHIEAHDIVFIVGDSIEETYPRLVNKWFGTTHKSLHIDSSVELDIVDGYKIHLSTNPNTMNHSSNYLYCVNFGGYKAGFFGENHEVNFYVGDSKKDVVKKAKADLCVGNLQQHCDDNLVVGGTDTHKYVDDIVKLGCVDGYYIHLTETTEPSTSQIISCYRRLDVPDILSKVIQEDEIVGHVAAEL